MQKVKKITIPLWEDIPEAEYFNKEDFENIAYWVCGVASHNRFFVVKFLPAGSGDTIKVDMVKGFYSNEMYINRQVKKVPSIYRIMLPGALRLHPSEKKKLAKKRKALKKAKRLKKINKFK